MLFKSSITFRWWLFRSEFKYKKSDWEKLLLYEQIETTIDCNAGVSGSCGCIDSSAHYRVEYLVFQVCSLSSG